MLYLGRSLKVSSRLALSLIASVFISVLFHASRGNAQGAIDLSQNATEYLITQRSGSTGDIFIYVSVPEWTGYKAGYCPVYVRVVPQRGVVFKTDGNLKVHFANGQYFSETGTQAVLEIGIEQGTTEARGEILANMFDTQVVNIFASLNGQRLSGQKVYAYNQLGYSGASNAPSLVVFSKDLSRLDPRRKTAKEDFEKTGRWYSQSETRMFGANKPIYADSERLPNNWLYLSVFDQVAVSATELEVLSPGAVQSLNNYALAGGVLIVCNVKSIKEVRRSFAINRDAARTDTDLRASKSKWIPGGVVALSVDVQNVQQSDFDSTLDLLPDTFWDQFQSRCLVDGFAGTARYNQQMYPNGMVVAGDLLETIGMVSNSLLEVGQSRIDLELSTLEIAASRLMEAYDVPFSSVAQVGTGIAKGQEDQADILQTDLTFSHGFGTVRLETNARRDAESLFRDPAGFSPEVPINRVQRFKEGIGDDFWGWLIPSVGRTPVIPFLVFVSAFAGLVVPGLLVWCNRHKRRVWLVVLMPLLAAFFTFALFAYGILKDGFGSVCRLRSFACLDVKGDGMVWSRQSYFAAVVPSEGFVVGRETQLSPLAIHSNKELPSSQQFDMEGKQVYVGLLQPRVQSQFSVTHPLQGVSIVGRSEENDEVLQDRSIRNASAFAWSVAMFVDAQSRCFIATEVAPGSQAECSEISMEDAIRVLRKKFVSVSTDAPVDAPSANQFTLNQFFRNQFNNFNNQGNNTGQIFEEDFWAERVGIAASRAGANQNVEPFQPLPRSFIILSDHAPYLERCLPGAVEQDGLHGIMGVW